SDLIAENHYDLAGDLLQKRGMGRYSESHESGRAFIGDGMEVKRKADIPMSAMWTPNPFTGGGDGIEVANNYKVDGCDAVAVPQICGKSRVAANSLPARANSFVYGPETLNPTADMELACGLNRFVIHTSVHQPLDDAKPGLSLGPFGQWFTRHET